MKKHRIGALLAAGVLALTFAGTALADGTIPWEGNGVSNGQIQTVQCDQDNPPGTIYWVLTSGGGKITDATLTVNGDKYHNGWSSGNGWKWQTPLYPVAGLTASAAFVGTVGNQGGNLVISHYCPATTTTTSSTSSTDTQTTDTQTTDTQTTDTQTTDTQTTDTQTTDTQTTDTATTTKTSSVEGESSTTTTSAQTSTKTTKTHSIEGVTAPSTDAMSGSSTPSAVSTGALLVVAGILALLMVLVPAAARSRR